MLKHHSLTVCTTHTHTHTHTLLRCPETSKVGDKMIYASTKDSLKKQFTGLGLEFQANDRGDFDYDEFCAEVEKKA